MARALGVQSRGIWHVMAGSLSAELEPSKKMENPHVSLFCSEANKYRSRKQNMIFQHFGRLFLPGTFKNVPYLLNELLVNFRAQSSGIGRFCRLEFKRMANWPSFDKKIETGRTIRNRRPVSSNSPCFDQKNETGPVGHPLVLRASKIDQSR